ncbi:hypothetical protein [Mycoplasma procyoni]|uniref:hypothetical protein n=1 Tax=Mycoplasma procyoni TaxID=568784 RepID=UPI00197B18CF|nr:hypothetical protein [Mycoplasma procyoni]MBN3534717.1 hypothetical protein [Mycoplasma procyoni]
MKQYLTFEQQLKRLKKVKNMKTKQDQEQEIIIYLKQNNYVHFFTPFKPVFAEIKNNEEIEWEQITQNWKGQNKYHNFFKSLYKTNENQDHIYKNWFSFDKLKNFNENNKKFSDYLLINILKLEKRIKSILANFIAKWISVTEVETFKGQYDKWLDFLETIWVNKEEYLKFRSKIEHHSNYIWFDIENLSFGNLQTLLENLLNENNLFLSKQEKKNLKFEIFKRNIYSSKIKRVISFTSRLRNFLAHSKNIQYFYILEVNDIIRKELLKKDYQIRIKTFEQSKFIYFFSSNEGVIPCSFDFFITKENKSVNKIIQDDFKTLIQIFKKAF